MSSREKENLVLALGRDNGGDEAVGLIAARELARLFDRNFDFIESSEEGGFHLLEIMSGYTRALLLDTVASGHGPAGMVYEYSADDVCHEVDPSPHYEGLCDVISMARRFEIPFPLEVRVLAMEIEAVPVDDDRLSTDVEMAMPRYLSRASRILEAWRECPSLKSIS